MNRRLKNVIYVLIINSFFFLCLEGALRFFDVGESTSIVIKEKHEEKDFLRTNTKYLYQYYPRLNNKIPTPELYLFEKEKPDSVFRVYIIGESTSQGFPYSKTEAFPFQVQELLNCVQHKKHVEVINFSISAATTYIGFDIAKEIVKYSPDLVILYFGNNDFVGIGGSAGYNNILFQANQIFSKLRIYQSIKLLASSQEDKDEAISTFEHMAQKEEVGYGTDIYEKTVKAFGDNYKKIVELFTGEKVPVITLGVAVNLKDMPPFKIQKDLTAQQYRQVRELLMKEITKSSLNRIVNIIGDNPKAYFIVAKEFLRQEKPALARYFYEKACDLDLIKFRATSDIRETIRNFTEAEGCYYLDLQAVFDQNSEENITGNDLMCEHVHPLLKGHSLIADTLGHFISNSFFSTKEIKGCDSIPIQHSMVDQMQSMNILYGMYATKLFKDINYINLNPRKELFDIKEEEGGRIGFTLKKDVDEEAFNHIKSMFSRDLSRYQMHINYGCWLTDKNKGHEAMAEFQIASLLNPDDYHSENNEAVLEFKMGLHEKAYQHISELRERLEGKDSFVTFNYNFICTKMNKESDLSKSELKQLSKVDASDLIYLYF